MPELRKDLITGRWVLVGFQEPKEFLDRALSPPETRDPAHCPFCPGNEGKAGPETDRIPDGDGPWLVRSVASAEAYLRPDGEPGRRGEGIYDRMANVGSHELIVETPEHKKNLADLPPQQVRLVLQMYQRRWKAHAKDERLRYGLLFKTQRKASPARFGHSHSQWIGFPVTPKEVRDELNQARAYFNYKERCVFCDMLRQETSEKRRIVLENDAAICFVPFAPRAAFEIWILPKEHNGNFASEPPERLGPYAEILRTALGKIAGALADPALHMTLHTVPYLRPFPGYWTTIQKDFHWHLEIRPVLSEAGAFETASGMAVAGPTPESCAELLRLA